MIRKEYENGGFPVNSRNPVLCFTEKGDLFITYNAAVLKKVIETKKVVKCVGVWPGKTNSDCFPLNPESYLIAPPIEHMDIDNAIAIKLMYTNGYQETPTIIYEVKGEGGVKKYSTTDKELLNYIIKTGKKHVTNYKKV